MKVETTTVTKMTISEVQSLDPIAVYLEDQGTGRGKITITCFNESWSYFWGAMGDQTLSEFFCSCDEHYIAKKLGSGLRSSVVDSEKIPDHARAHIVELRRDGGLERAEARELYDEAEWIEGQEDHDLLYKIFGCEWWDDLPTKPNPDYEYLCRIITTVQSALRLEAQKEVG